MPVKVSEGFTKSGIACGQRQLRAPRSEVRSRLLENPLALAGDLALVILSFLLHPLAVVWELFSPGEPASFRGKVALVTGSGRGLGREICLGLAKEGAVVCCADINVENNQETERQLRALGAQAKAYKLNIANKKEVERTIKEIEDEFGAVDILVNNAALVMAKSADHDEEYIRAIFNINVLGSIWVTEAVLPKMISRGEGRIGFVSSASAYYGIPFLSYYGSTKAALSNYAQSLRLKMLFEGLRKIKVTSTHPLFINTSADYVDIVKSKVDPLSSSAVASHLLDAMKRGAGDCSPNIWLAPFFSAARFFPLNCVERLVTLLRFEVVLPTDGEFEELPFGSIVKEGNQLDKATKLS